CCYGNDLRRDARHLLRLGRAEPRSRGDQTHDNDNHGGDEHKSRDERRRRCGVRFGTRPELLEVWRVSLIFKRQLREQRPNSLFVSTEFHNRLPLDPVIHANVSCRARNGGAHYQSRYSSPLRLRLRSGPDRRRGAASRVDDSASRPVLAGTAAAARTTRAQAQALSWISRRDFRALSRNAALACDARWRTSFVSRRRARFAVYSHHDRWPCPEGFSNRPSAILPQLRCDCDDSSSAPSRNWPDEAFRVPL